MSQFFRRRGKIGTKIISPFPQQISLCALPNGVMLFPYETREVQLMDWVRAGARQIAYPVVITIALLLAACSSPARTAAPSSASPTPSQATESASALPTPTPEWFDTRLTDVRTGETFTINDLKGKVVLIETMAEWCPNCRHQEDEVKTLHTLVENPADLVSISLDVDLHEDEASLKKYAEAFGYDWRFVVAPMDVQRALGNLYSAEYLNPPLTPMLLINRKGQVFGLPNGIKSAQALKATLEPHLAQ